MAHTRLPNPTGNGEPRGKGKTNKGSGMGGGGWCVCVCMQRVWMERIGGGGVYGVQGLCVRWCFVGVVLMFLLLQRR